MKAKLIKQTDNAVQVTYNCDIYGEVFTVKNVWLPKSQLEIISTENDVLEFNTKNDWILDSKTKEYCQWVVRTFSNVVSEIKTYTSRINNYRVEYCYI